MVAAEGGNYSPDTSAAAEESFVGSSNIYATGAHLEPTRMV